MRFLAGASEGDPADSHHKAPEGFGGGWDCQGVRAVVGSRSHVRLGYQSGRLVSVPSGLHLAGSGENLWLGTDAGDQCVVYNVRLRIINGESIHKKKPKIIHTPEKQKGELIHKSFCEGQKDWENVPPQKKFDN